MWTREPVSAWVMDDCWNGNRRRSKQNSFALQISYLHDLLLIKAFFKLGIASEGHMAMEIKVQNIKDPSRYCQKNCNEWVNFSCFLARFLEAGLMGNGPDRCKYSSIDIRAGLDDDLPPGPIRDCKLMVAAQHILLAGRVLAGECFNQSLKSFSPDKWRQWAGRLEEISKQERGKNESLASAAKNAHEYMMSLPYEPPSKV